jgi:hypothetical protein
MQEKLQQDRRCISTEHKASARDSTSSAKSSEKPLKTESQCIIAFLQ